MRSQTTLKPLSWTQLFVLALALFRGSNAQIMMFTPGGSDTTQRFCFETPNGESGGWEYETKLPSGNTANLADYLVKMECLKEGEALTYDNISECYKNQPNTLYHSTPTDETTCINKMTPLFWQIPQKDIPTLCKNKYSDKFKAHK